MVYALFEIGVWGDLYFDRDYYCIEKYRSPQKRCDAISVFHNLSASFFGEVVAFTGTVILTGRRDIDLSPWYLGSLSALILDALILFLAVTRSGLPAIRDSIKMQWDTQKRVSDENDHEVNMYRGAVRVCSSYPRHTLYFLTILLVAWYLMMFFYY